MFDSSTMISLMLDGVGLDRRGDVLVAERAIALAVTRVVQVDDRDLLARDVAPDVELGPAQQRMDAHVRAFRQVALEVVPEFRRLVAEVPGAAFGARREHALLGAGRLLVAADAGDDALELELLQHVLEADGLARGGARGRRQAGVDLLDRRAIAHDQIEVPRLGEAVAELVHLRGTSCRYRHARPGRGRGRGTPCAPATA